MRLEPLSDSLVSPLSSMLAGIGDSFRPFGFTPAEIRAAAHEEDEHWVIVDRRGRVVAYGMLRGWHDGYAVPALGLAVARMHRRRGYGTAMVLFLHYLAARRGAEEVMLHVDGDNVAAQSLYLSVGYKPAGDRWICRLRD